VDDRYVAGLFDGEGCIQIGQTGTLLITLGNTNYLVLNKLQGEYGGFISKLPKRVPRHLDCWVWSIHSKKSIQFLERISSHLIIKKRQVELGLHYILNKRDIRKMKHYGEIQMERDWREQVVTKMKAMKKEQTFPHVDN